MPHTIYLIGAGLSKSLESPAHAVPLMTDFVRVLADYVENDVVLTTLAELENAGVFTNKCEEVSRLAQLFVGKAPDRSPQNRDRFARCLRDRPAESIEGLIERSSQVVASSSSADLKTRFLFAINQVFSTVGWHIRSAPLEQFLLHQFHKADQNHTFINFNYDLILDRTIQPAPGSNWHPAYGYGFHIPYFTKDDPPPAASSGVLRRARATQFGGTRESDYGAIQILKPHGSLNWLLPFKIPYETGKHGRMLEPEPMVLPLDADNGLRYWPTTADFNHIECPGAAPADYGIFIIPPSSEKSSDLKFLEEVETREVEAISECEDVFVVGYSLPTTDVQHDALIRAAVTSRSVGFRRLVIVNYAANADYFRRVAAIFSFPEQRVEIFNSGFLNFVDAFCG
jgi:hypothetical protein